MIFSLLKSKICAKCDTVFIVPMRRNKHNITYLPTYLTYLVNLHTLLTYYLFTIYLHTYLLVPETQPWRAAYLLKDRIGTGILHHLSTPAMRCRFVLRQGESAKLRQNILTDDLVAQRSRALPFLALTWCPGSLEWRHTSVMGFPVDQLFVL